MKGTTLLIFLFTSMSFDNCHGQSKPSLIKPQQQPYRDNFEYSYKGAHPAAQALMKEEFLWSPVVENAPFGSDDGSDAAYGFRKWRRSNKNTSPVRYLKQLIEEWRYPFFDYNEMDTSKISAYIHFKADDSEEEIQQRLEVLKEALRNSPDTMMQNASDDQLREAGLFSQNMGGIYLLGQDNAIIGIGFAQFVLEGHIDKDITAATLIALKRQLLPLLLDRYEDETRGERKEQLTKLLQIITKA